MTVNINVMTRLISRSRIVLVLIGILHFPINLAMICKEEIGLNSIRDEVVEA